MYDQLDVVGEFEPDDLDQIGRRVRSDGELLGWVSIGFEFDNNERVVESMADARFVVAVPERRSMKLDTLLS